MSCVKSIIRQKQSEKKIKLRKHLNADALINWSAENSHTTDKLCPNPQIMRL